MTRRKINMKDNPELEAVSRKMATLALQKSRQEGLLKVRQREQLRRALATAAESLGWGLIPGDRTDRVAVAAQDMALLADAGAKSLEQDLVELLDGKKNELKELKKVAKSVTALAADKKATFPTEIDYSYTARNGTRGLFTKVETVTVNDADEALSAAAAIEKRFDTATKLRDEMLIELKQKLRQVGEVRKDAPAFIEASSGIVVDVLATLT
jgi:hypothetical protein